MNKIVAIDGPAGSGKGTITKIIAERCHLVSIDTGVTYRSLALAVIKHNLTLNDEDQIIALAKKIKITIDNNGNVFLDGEDVTKDIRGENVSKLVSFVAQIKEVRQEMVRLQQSLAEGKDVIIEGRDITTVVFPNAQYKFYLDADLEERAKRRYKQNIENGLNISYEDVLNDIKTRDYNDMHNETGALKIAPDAIYIDSTHMTIEEVVQTIINIIEGD